MRSKSPPWHICCAVDPASARSRIEAALAARELTGCYHFLLVGVGKLHFDPLLEEIADRSLWDSDPEVAGNAADFLGQFGSTAAEQHLWERFEQWSGEWHGRESELKFVPGEQNPNIWQSGLGRNLALSLSRGQAWLANSAKLQKIGQLSVETYERQQFERMSDAWRGNWSISCFGPLGGAPNHCMVLQYSDLSFEHLKQKVAQFPTGSKFQWVEAVQPKPPDHDDMYYNLSKFLSEHGMSLSKAN